MIEVTGLSIKFDDRTQKLFGNQAETGCIHRSFALDNVSLTIPEGVVYGFLGSNGAGKSTLMRCISGIYRTDSGSVKIDGRDVFDNPEAKADIFFVNDETIEYTGYTLNALKDYYSSYYPSFDSKTYYRLLNVLKLPENAPLSTFSKGMKRQAVVIIGLACRTKYLMLDEAFDGLDPSMRELVKKMIIEEIRSNNAALIVSSHNIHEIGELCDRAMLIHEGHIIFEDDPKTMNGNFRKIQLVRLSGAVTAEEIESAGIKVHSFSQTGSVVQIVAKKFSELDERIKTIGADLAEYIPMSLEEILIYELDRKGV